MRRAVPLAFLLLTFATVAAAQTAMSTGVISQGRICLDVDGQWTARRPPPPDTRVVAKPCDGSPSQRWTVTMGDENHIRSIGDRTLAARGTSVLVSAHRYGIRFRSFLRSSQIGTDTECLTLVSPQGPLAMEPCRSGDARQVWQLR